ncbi:MAG TPA: endonuclease/exonuclease/phosphatase family protein [Aestuariivirgaceae bacterium]|nr:endonuclease/exonuclease/phosphatase family protein [Aestuariivirgaceae bacterium]
MTWKDDPMIMDEYDRLAPTPRSAAPPLPVEERPRRRRRTRGKTRCLLAFLLASGLLMATRLSQLWLVFDVLNQFTLQFAIVAAAFLIGYFVPFGRVLVGMLLTIAGMAATGLYPQYFSDKPEIIGSVQPNEKELRLFSFNSRLHNDKAEAVADEILRHDPDIATLIEFGEEKRVALDRLRAKYPYVAGCINEPFCHLAIISKVPIVSSEARALWAGPPLIRATLGGDFAGMVVVGVHTIRAPHVRAQFSQMNSLAEYLFQFDKKAIVMGDFNATPFSRVLEIFSDRTRLRRLTWLPTWPATVELPQLGIDHIFVSPEFRVIERERIGRSSGSDHYPVTVKVAVPVR